MRVSNYIFGRTNTLNCDVTEVATGLSPYNDCRCIDGNPSDLNEQHGGAGQKKLQ